MRFHVTLPLTPAAKAAYDRLIKALLFIIYNVLMSDLGVCYHYMTTNLSVRAGTSKLVRC